MYTFVPPQNDPLPQRASLYKLGNQLALESEHDGFESFQYMDQTQVTSYKKSGNKICVTLENINTGTAGFLLLSGGKKTRKYFREQ